MIQLIDIATRNWLIKMDMQIDNSTKESTSGKFMVYDGTVCPW